MSKSAFIAGFMAARAHFGAYVDGTQHGVECNKMDDTSYVCTCDIETVHNDAVESWESVAFNYGQDLTEQLVEDLKPLLTSAANDAYERGVAEGRAARQAEIDDRILELAYGYRRPEVKRDE